ncbi:MAG: hypothetical protein QM775_32995 [Pirellulales bacterium]
MASVANATDVRRRTAHKAVVVMACGAIVVPLLFAAWARGAERTSGFRTVSAGSSSLKWRPSSTARRNDAATTTASPSASTGSALFEAPAVPTPDLLDADESARPLESETAASRIMHDEAVTPVQGTKPVDDPFGDNKPAAPAPRLLTQPTPDPEVSQPRTPLTLPPAAPTNLPPLPSSTDQMAQAGGVFQQEPCPKISDLKAISQITNKIAASAGDLPRECYFDESVATADNRAWAMTQYHWKASGMCHKPLYFEEVGLERYGHSTGPFSQPLVSGAHFFGSVLVLPYKMGIDPPTECKYALGYYRPGSCAPYIIPGVPITGRAIANQAALVSGLIWLWP